MRRREFLNTAAIAGTAGMRFLQDSKSLRQRFAETGPEMARRQPRWLAGAREMDHAGPLCRRASGRRIYTLRAARQNQGDRAAQAASRNLDHRRRFRLVEGARHQRSANSGQLRSARREPTIHHRDRHSGLGFSNGEKARHRRLARLARSARKPERLGPQRPPRHPGLAHEQGKHRSFAAHRRRLIRTMQRIRKSDRLRALE